MHFIELEVITEATTHEDEKHAELTGTELQRRYIKEKCPVNVNHIIWVSKASPKAMEQGALSMVYDITGTPFWCTYDVARVKTLMTTAGAVIVKSF